MEKRREITSDQKPAYWFSWFYGWTMYCRANEMTLLKVVLYFSPLRKIYSHPPSHHQITCVVSWQLAYSKVCFQDLASSKVWFVTPKVFWSTEKNIKFVEGVCVSIIFFWISCWHCDLFLLLLLLKMRNLTLPLLQCEEQHPLLVLSQPIYC